MALFFNRQSPLPSPPSQGSLKFWLDAQDLTVADGTEILTMNNKGTLGGTFIQRNDISINGNPTATTVDGKRALYYAPNIDQGLISTQNISENTITVLTVTQNEANKIPGAYGAPWANDGYHCTVGGYWHKFALGNHEGWGDMYPYFYNNYWDASRPGSPEPFIYDTTIDSGVTLGIVVQFDTTLTNPTTFYKIKKDSADFSKTYAPGLSFLDAGPLVVGGILSAGGAGGARFTFAGKIFEIIVWQGITDVTAIRQYLNQKYGGTW